jgi:hypothetical protein
MKMEVLMRGQALLMAGAMAVAAVTAVPATAAAQSNYSSYASQDQVCAKKRQDRMIAGGALGAIAGAVLGSNVAGRGAKSEGGALGAVAGAVAGGMIGRNTAKCGPYDQYGYHNGQYGQHQGGGQYGGPYNGQYGDDGYGLEGGPYAPAAYGGGGYNNGYGQQQCRYGEQILRDPDGRSYKQNVYMCRGADGVWRAQ